MGFQMWYVWFDINDLRKTIEEAIETEHEAGLERVKQTVEDFYLLVTKKLSSYEVVQMAGDELILKGDQPPSLSVLREMGKEVKEQLGTGLSVGIGATLSEAYRALKLAKRRKSKRTTSVETYSPDDYFPYLVWSYHSPLILL
jgi:hypothetical protein